MLRRLTLQLLQTTSTKPFYLSNLLLSLPLSHPAPLLQFYVQVLLYASIQHSFVIERKTAPMDMMRTVWKHVLTKVSFQILALRPRFWDTFLLSCCFSVWYIKRYSPQLIFSARTVGAVSPRVWFVTVTLIVTMAQMRSTVRANLLLQPWSVALGQNRVMMAQSVFYIAMCVTERETVRMDQMNKDAQTHADKVSL